MGLPRCKRPVSGGSTLPSILSVEVVDPTHAVWTFDSEVTVESLDWANATINAESPNAIVGGGATGDTTVQLEYTNPFDPGDPWAWVVGGSTPRFQPGTTAMPGQSGLVA